MGFFLEGEKPKLEDICEKFNGTYYVCFRKYEDTGTIHIFCCNCEEYYQEIECHCNDEECLCNCVQRSNKDKFVTVKECMSIEEARKVVFSLKKKGQNVCGVCISALYHNDL